MDRLHRLLIAACVIAAATTSSHSIILNRPTLFRLEKTSTFKRGCFPPCMCPALETSSISGTFRLALTTVGNVFDFYQVTGVRFTVRRPNGEIILVTGSGTYDVSTIIDAQRMELTLEVGDEPGTLYASEFAAPGGDAFPEIMVPISIHGGYCDDTVIDVHARPARRLYVEPSEIHWDRNANTNMPSDVVFGDLGTLRDTGGAFDVATWACAVDSNPTGSSEFAGAPGPNEGYWFLERETGDVYEDADAAQVGSPDPEIALSPGACP